jgi:3-polyprenyl-4-hydroxybenzoate decarboxylase
VVVVDDDIDVTDMNDVLWAIFTRMDPERSVDIMRRAMSSPLDPAIPPNDKRYNSLLLIDATPPFEWKDKFATPIGPDPKTKAETRKRWGTSSRVPKRPLVKSAEVRPSSMTKGGTKTLTRR